MEYDYKDVPRNWTDEDLLQQFEALQRNLQALQDEVDDIVFQAEQVFPRASLVLRFLQEGYTKFYNLKEEILNTAVDDVKECPWIETLEQLQEFFDDLQAAVHMKYESFQQEVDWVTNELLNSLTDDIEELENRSEGLFPFLFSSMKERIEEGRNALALVKSGDINFRQFWNRLSEIVSEIFYLKEMSLRNSGTTSQQDDEQVDLETTPPLGYLTLARSKSGWGPLTLNSTTDLSSSDNDQSIEELLSYRSQLVLDSDDEDAIDQTLDSLGYLGNSGVAHGNMLQSPDRMTSTPRRTVDIPVLWSADISAIDEDTLEEGSPLSGANWAESASTPKSSESRSRRSGVRRRLFHSPSPTRSGHMVESDRSYDFEDSLSPRANGGEASSTPRRRLAFPTYDRALEVDEGVWPLSTPPRRIQEHRAFMPVAFAVDEGIICPPQFLAPPVADATFTVNEPAEVRIRAPTVTEPTQFRDPIEQAWYRENVGVYQRPDGSPKLRPRRPTRAEDEPFLGRIIPEFEGRTSTRPRL